jgi:prepilin-type N-terminal cleavage/methylation domain-containing protein
MVDGGWWVVVARWERRAPPPATHHPPSGFTLIEMLVATAVMLTVTGAVFELMHPSHGVVRAQLEASDRQQRLRVGVDSLRKDLILAAAGPDSGTSPGALDRYFAAVLPYRVGDSDSDPSAGVFFRPDVISLVYVPAAASQTTIRAPQPAATASLRVEPQAGCPRFAANRLCGFTKGMRVMLFDSSGRWDPITIIGVNGPSLELAYEGTLSTAYATGTHLTQVAMHTYYLNTHLGTSTSQLMHYDGETTDLPVVDDVARLAFEYVGESQPPLMLADAPVAAPARRWTTYGPRPPDLGAASPFGWPDGENCVFAVAAGRHVPRLPVLGDGTRHVPLDPSMLTDGPWCPHLASRGRFDADLLRVRRVRVTLRVQLAAESMRSRGALLVRPGGAGLLADQEIRFDVAPRNLNMGR